MQPVAFKGLYHSPSLSLLPFCSYWVLLFHFQQCTESVCGLFCQIQYRRRYGVASGRQLFHYAKKMKIIDVPASRVLHSDYVDLCICVSAYTLSDCLSRRARVCMHTYVCVAVAVRLCVPPVSVFHFLQMV